jgi:hypothetical protein
MVGLFKTAFIDKENNGNGNGELSKDPLEDQAQAQAQVLALGLHPATSTQKVFTVLYMGCITVFLARLVPELEQLPCPTSFVSPDPATLASVFPACIFRCTPQALDDLTKKIQGVLSMLQQRAQDCVL